MKQNVHRKKMIVKDTKAKARELDYFSLLNIFVVIGLNYWKMKSIVYNSILEELLLDLQGITLC